MSSKEVEKERELAQGLITASKRFADRGWCMATGGNFSARIGNSSEFLITASGVDKQLLSEEDFIWCSTDWSSKSGELKNDGERKPSAETAIHTELYRLDPEVNCVLHTHSVAATVLSLHYRADKSFLFSGYEMQKTVSGVYSHEESVEIPIFDNTQDIVSFSKDEVSKVLKRQRCVAFLLRGHGLYAWGKSILEATRHLEGIEFLLSCKLAGLERTEI